MFDGEDCPHWRAVRSFAGAPRGALGKHEAAFLPVVTDRAGQRTVSGRSISADSPGEPSGLGAPPLSRCEGETTATRLPRRTGAAGQAKPPGVEVLLPRFAAERGLGAAASSPRWGEGSPRSDGDGSGGRRRGAAPGCGGRRTAGPGGGAAAEASRRAGPGRAAERAGGPRRLGPGRVGAGPGQRRSGGASVRRGPPPLRGARRGLVPPAAGRWAAAGAARPPRAGQRRRREEAEAEEAAAGGGLGPSPGR